MSLTSTDIAALMEFLEAARGKDDPRLIGAIFDIAIRRLGFGDFSLRLGKLRPAGDKPYDAIWTYPAPWEEHFSASNYFLTSPVYHFARRLRRPFNWFELLALPNLSKRERHIFFEAADFSIGMGLTVPIHAAHAPSAVFTITSDQSLDPSADSIRVHERVAHLLGLGFYEMAGSLLHDQQLALREAASFDVAANDNAPSGGMRAPYEMRHELTPFERECLTWSAAGLDPWAISERFWLSAAMVHRALEAARLKLGATTQDHAVVRALASNLIAI